MKFSEFSSRNYIHIDYFVWMNDYDATCNFENCHIIIRLGKRDTGYERIKSVDFFVRFGDGNPDYVTHNYNIAISKELNEKLWEFDALMFKNEWNEEESYRINDFMKWYYGLDKKTFNVVNIDGGFIITRKPDILEEILNGNKS